MKLRTPLVGALTAAMLVATAIGVASASPAAPNSTVAGAPAGAVYDPPTIPDSTLQSTLQAFQTIASNNGGNRAHGRPGYKASADYVKGRLDAVGFTTQMLSFSYNGATGYNVIAEWPHGDANNVIMAGAHLDSVTAGPGLHDNGSGSAAVLETAVLVARENLRPTKRLRFGWWGAEELGLIGSNIYARDTLGETGRAKINYYLNFDMVGQKNTNSWGIYTQSSNLVPMWKEYFGPRGLTTFNTTPGGNTDHYSFSRYGVKVSGLSAGGGDPCYHSSCDTINNISARAVAVTANALSYMMFKLGGGTTTTSPTVGPTGSPTVDPTPTTTTPPGTCTGYTNNFSGSLSSGGSAYQPNNSYFQTTVSGSHRACLDGPSGTDYDLYLQKWNGSAWSNVASGTTPAADETLTYSGSAGYYRYRVHAYSGSGMYQLGYNRP